MKCLICKKEIESGYKISPITNKPTKGTYCTLCYERLAAHKITEQVSEQVSDEMYYDNENGPII